MTDQPPLTTRNHDSVPQIGRQSARVAAVVLVLLATLVGAWSSRTPHPMGAWGTKDFIEYWAANQVVSQDGNPYDPASLRPVEQAAGRTEDVPLMMWNPPWLLVLMRPVFHPRFEVAASTWLAVNIVLATASCVLIASGYRKERLTAIDFIPAVIGSVISVPTVMTLHLGQVSLLLLFAVSLLYWSVRHGHDVLAGFACAMLTIKPHLFFLVAVLLAVMVVREQRWRIAAGAAAGMSVLVACTLLNSPHSVINWWQSVQSPPAGAPPAYTWRTPNLPNLVRDLLASSAATSPTWPLTVIPALTLVLCAIWLWRRSRITSIDHLFPLVLCASVITAPFGWTFDHVLLTVPQVIVFLRAFGEVRRAVYRWILPAAMLLCHFGLIVQEVETGTDYSGFWWFPLSILAVWLLSEAWLSGEPAAT